MSHRLCVVVYWLAFTEALVLVSLSTAQAEEAKPASRAEDHIRQEFLKPTSYDFVETPLAEVMNFIAKKHEIDIKFDQKALTDLGITTDRPISKSVSGVSLRSALNLLMRDLDLVAVIRNEVLLITTPDEANKWLSIKVYDIRDLVPEAGYDKFVKDIMRQVAPTTWDEVGGAGSVSHFSSSGIDALIVSQTAPVHEDLENLLADLRRLRKSSKDK
jgi:hypothetical protein